MIFSAQFLSGLAGGINPTTKPKNGVDADAGGGSFYSGKLSQDYTTMRIIWKKRFDSISSVTFFSALCNKDSKVFDMLNTMGFVTPPHRCPIPIADYPNKVAILNTKSPEKFFQRLSYIMGDNIAGNGSQYPLFGGHQTWQQREESFKIKPTMRVHCGFMKGGRAEMASNDVKYVKKCRFVVATGIFDAYDTPHQPSNISQHSQDLLCFLMVVDEVSLGFIKESVPVKEDIDGGLWVGIWRLILLKNQPYDELEETGRFLRY